MILHPLYDTAQLAWVATVDGQEIEAKSISALLDKAGPGHDVQDYFPAGVPFELLPRASVAPGSQATRRHPILTPRPGVRMPPNFDKKAMALIRASVRGIDPEPLPKQPYQRKSRSRASKGLPAPIQAKPEREASGEERARVSERNNQILDGWAAGETGPQLAARFNMTVSAIAANIIPKARSAGDPRAVVRNPKTHGTKKVSFNTVATRRF